MQAKEILIFIKYDLAVSTSYDMSFIVALICSPGSSKRFFDRAAVEVGCQHLDEIERVSTRLQGSVRCLLVPLAQVRRVDAHKIPALSDWP